MNPIEYRITSIDSDISPKQSETPEIRIAISISMGDAAIDDDDILTSDCEMQIRLVDPEEFSSINESQNFDNLDPEYGNIEIEFRIEGKMSEEILGSNVDIDEEIEIWNSDGYGHVDPAIISRIESGFVSEIFAPLEHLLDDTVRGILPRYRFTRTVNEQEQLEQYEESGDEQ